MTAIIWMFGGAAIGAGVALALYILGLVVELFNCAFQIVTCNCTGKEAISAMWSGSAFVHVLMFCCIGGAIIGLIYGIYKMKLSADEKASQKSAESAEEARKQRVKWANEIKQEALNITTACGKNKSFDKPIVSTTYQASSQMRDIINELTKVAELQGKIDSITNELAKKGGGK